MSTRGQEPRSPGGEPVGVVPCQLDEPAAGSGPNDDVVTT